MSSVAFPQNADDSSVDKAPKTKMLIEFGKVSNGEFKSIIDKLFIELQSNPTAQGYILIYGMSKQVAARERLLRNQIVFRSQDGSRITFVRGKAERIIRTQFWIVPDGAESPTP